MMNITSLAILLLHVLMAQCLVASVGGLEVSKESYDKEKHGWLEVNARKGENGTIHFTIQVPEKMNIGDFNLTVYRDGKTLLSSKVATKSNDGKRMTQFMLDENLAKHATLKTDASVGRSVTFILIRLKGWIPEKPEEGYAPGAHAPQLYR